MDLKEFVNSLSLDTFESLRVAVVTRQTRQASEFAAAFEYLISQQVLMKAAQTKPQACARILAEKSGFDIKLMAKVVAKYLADPDLGGAPLVVKEKSPSTIRYGVIPNEDMPKSK